MEVIDKRKVGFIEKIKTHPTVKRLLKIKNLRLMIVGVIIAITLIIYSSVQKVDENNIAPMVMDDEETRLANILSGIEGVGEVRTMITRSDGQITGILVVADGAEDISVMLKLLSATSTVMGVDKQVVEVYQME